MIIPPLSHLNVHEMCKFIFIFKSSWPIAFINRVIHILDHVLCGVKSLMSTNNFIYIKPFHKKIKYTITKLIDS